MLLRTFAEAVLLCSLVAACSADDFPKPACLSGGVVPIGEKEPFDLEQTLVATYDVPAGEPTGTVNVRVRAEGEASRTSRPEGLESPFCLFGSVDLQWASAEVDVFLEGLDYTFSVPFGSAILERQVGGEGVHFSLSVHWNVDELPAELEPFTRSSVERVYRERPDLVGYEMTSPWVWLRHQQGGPKPPRGVLVYQADFINPDTPRKDQWMDTWEIELLSAQLTLPEP